jgi:hypothetical protein
MSFIDFSEFSLKIRKIVPSSVKITYDSKYAVWVETDLLNSDMKLAENGRVTLPFPAKRAFGQMGFRPNEVGSLLPTQLPAV